MKLILTTTYSDIDEAWLSWYIERLKKALPTQALQLETEGVATLASRDPSSNAMAVTTYTVLENGRERSKK